MAEQATSVTVNIGAEQFSTDLAVANRLIWELVGEGDDENQVKLNLFPDDSAINVTTTTGSISFADSRIRHVVEVLTFSNSDRVSLRYSNAQSVSITPFGSFLDAVTGNTVPQILKHDFNTSEIVASKKVYGVIRVIYDAPYQEFIYTFPETCPITPPDIDPDTGATTQIFTDGVVLALWPLGLGETAAATLQLSNANDRCLFLEPEAETGGLIIEKRSSKPTNKEGEPFEYVTLFRVYPANLQPTFEVTEGLKPILAPADSNKKIKVVNEFLSFANTFSRSVRYPLNTGISAVPEGDIFDEFNREIEVADQMIALPGSTITEVRWRDSFTIAQKLSKRKVRLGEIVITDGQGNTKPISGLLRATYDATYDTFIYRHITTRTGSENVNIGGAIFTVRAGKLVAIFTIEPRFGGAKGSTTEII